MTLRLKTFSILLATVVCLLGALLALAGTLLLRGYRVLEAQHVREGVERVLGALSVELAALERAADECVPLAGEPGGLSVPALVQTDLSLLADVCLVCDDGGPVRGIHSEPVPEPYRWLDERLRRDAVPLVRASARRRSSGLLAHGDRVALVALRVLPVAADGAPGRRFLIAARAADGRLVGTLGSRTGLKVSLAPLQAADSVLDFEQTAVFGDESVPVAVQRLTAEEVAGQAYLADLFGFTSIALTAGMPRTIMRQGRVSVTTFAIILTGCCIAFGIVMLMLLEEQVLKRITGLSREVVRIGASSDVGERVEVTGRDEIAALGRAINEMLEQLSAAEQQLVQAEKLASLGVLVAGIAHEINNPNQFIMTNLAPVQAAWKSARPVLDAYLEEHGDFRFAGSRYSRRREQLDEMLGNIASGSQRIKTIVRELRDYAQESAADDRKPVQINRVARSALALLANLLKTSTRRFEADFDEELPDVSGNAQRLEQVTVNLLQNACQSLPSSDAGVRLVTRAGPGGGSVILEVVDEGRGIAAEVLPQITDPFFTTRRESGGTGLGLSISSRIVERHGGTLSFESTPGRGTTARLELPALGETETTTDWGAEP